MIRFLDPIGGCYGSVWDPKQASTIRGRDPTLLEILQSGFHSPTRNYVDTEDKDVAARVPDFSD